MKFHSIAVRDIGPFKGEHSLDLRELQGKLVAVCGANGAGKSTLLELLAGGVYRTCPTRGRVSGLATSPHASLDLVVEDGEVYRLRHVFDPNTGKSESLVERADGSAVVSTGKVRDFDTWRAEHLVPSELLYASSFAAQGRRGMLDLAASQRKALLLRMLGCERLEELAARARERRTSAGNQSDRLRAVRAEVAEHDVAALDEQLGHIEHAKASAQVAVDGARMALARAQEAAADMRERERLRAAHRVAADNHRQATRALTTARERRRELVERHERLFAPAEAAHGRLPYLRQRVADATTEVAAARARLAQANAEARETEGRLRAAREAMFEIDKDLVRARRRLSQADEIAEAAHALPGARDLRDRAREALVQLEAERGELVVLTTTALDRRIRALRASLDCIASGADASDAIAGATLQRDDEEIDAGVARVAGIAQIGGRIEQTQTQSEVARVECERLQLLAARAGEVERANADLQVLLERCEALVRQCAALEETKVGQVVLVQSRDAAERDAAEILDAAGERLRACNADASRFAELSADAGRIEQLDERILEAVAHEQRRRDELDSAPDVQVDGSIDVANVRAPLERAERELARLGVAEGRLRGERDNAERDVARAAQLDAEVQSACAERDDWGKLGDDLGRDGLQAMEIDAAVPEINTLANDLLHTCHGSRFTIEVRTDRSSADGKRTLEGLDVRVLDTVGGRDDLAETYSGGECVIVGEALALALTVVACRRRGVTAPTLVRDESGAALDAENGRAYVAMLRRAAEAVGAACTLVVSHDAGVRELCDARIEIAAGRIEVKA